MPISIKTGATPKSIRVGDTVRLKAERNSKLSTNFNSAPFTVIQKTGTEVTLRNEAGIRLKRNTAVVKKYNEHIDVAIANGDRLVQGSSTVQADESGQRGVSETTEVTGSSKNQVTSGVSEISQVKTGNCTENEDNDVRRPVRRSTLAIRQPACYEDFVLDV